jgi:hypothetical protein
MKVRYPHCGQEVQVDGLGRPKLNIPLKNIYDALTKYASIRAAAQHLGCSPGYIYRELKKVGMRPKNILYLTNKTISE